MYLTGGVIPRAVALTIAPLSTWVRLSEATGGGLRGLADPMDNGWMIHDYEAHADPQRERHLVDAPTGETFVYFVQSGDDGAIKIGWSSDPDNRISDLQTGNPVVLRLLCCLIGGASIERALHERFANHRLQGEWFAPHEDILLFIERSSRGIEAS